MPQSVSPTLVLVEVDISLVAVRVDQSSSYAAVRCDRQRDRVSGVPSYGPDRRLRVEFLHAGILSGIATHDRRHESAPVARSRGTPAGRRSARLSIARL